MRKFIYAVSILAMLAPAGLVLAAPDQPGTNVKDSTGTIYFITPDGQRRPYTSAGAFLSYGLNSFSNVATESSDDAALPAGSFIPPQDGKIICSDRGADKGTCYLISQSTKVGFPSAQIFTAAGFSFKNALYGDTSFLPYSTNITDGTAAHLPGVLVNNGGTIYLVGPSGLMGIPSMQTFLSWGYTLADVVPANAADKQQTVSGIMPTHSAGLLSPLTAALSFGGGTQNTSPTPTPTQNTGPTPTPVVYQTYGETSTPEGAITISADASTPATQQIAMSAKSQALYAINFAETSGNEAVNLTGLIITATVNGGATIGNSLPNTGYDTLKNFQLVNGSTVISRSSWSASSIRREGPGSQTYYIDFQTGSPLSFQIASSSSLTLTLKADTNDWSTDAAANSNWTFSVVQPTDATLVGQLSGQTITPTITNSAASNVTTVVKQPITFNPVSSFAQGSNSAVAQAAGAPTTQETVAIFNSLSPSTAQNLSSITLSQSGSALPTSTPVNYYIFDAAKSMAQPVGLGSILGGGSVTIPLNLNSAVNGGVVIPSDGSEYLVIKADTTSFFTCTEAAGCTSPNSYDLSLTNWQWTDPLFPGQTYSGPFGSGTAITPVYSGGTARTY